VGQSKVGATIDDCGGTSDAEAATDPEMAEAARCRAIPLGLEWRRDVVQGQVRFDVADGRLPLGQRHVGVGKRLIRYLA